MALVFTKKCQGQLCDRKFQLSALKDSKCDKNGGSFLSSSADPIKLFCN
jgi:hypothetical protein